jgi:hypothetical protein
MQSGASPLRAVSYTQKSHNFEGHQTQWHQQEDTLCEVRISHFEVNS